MKSSINKGFLVILILSFANICWHIFRFNPDYLVGDQWGLWNPLLNNSSFMEGFFHQHGSHFLGLGYIFSLVAGNLSGFDPRAESISTALLMSLNAILAFRLKTRITGSQNWFDLIFPILFLNPMFTEVFLWTAHASVAALPIMLLLLLAHLTLFQNSTLKGILIFIIGFLSVFTGYAFIVYGLCVIYTLYSLFVTKHQLSSIISIILQIAIAILFVALYKIPGETICGFKSSLSEYFQYIITMFFQFFGGVAIKPSTIIILAIGIVSPVTVALFTYNFNYKSQKLHACFVLVSFSLLYILLNTYGRACVGPETARAPRYSVFIIPIFLACYCILSTDLIKKQGYLKYLPILFVLTFLIFRLKPNKGHQVHLIQTGEAYKNWRLCYERHKDISHCKTQTGVDPLFFTDNKRGLELWNKFIELQEN